MFLGELNIKESEFFLELAYLGMQANGELKESEMEIFTNFKYECAMPDYEIQNIEIQTILDFFNNASKSIKNVTMIELIGIFLADGDFCEKEQQFVDIIIEEWDLTQSQFRRMKRWVSDCSDMLMDGYRIIGKE